MYELMNWNTAILVIKLFSYAVSVRWFSAPHNTAQ
jgi:hypothetical protein